jgi:hypothetical protein
VGFGGDACGEVDLRWLGGMPHIREYVRDLEQRLPPFVDLFVSLVHKIAGRKTPVDMVVPAIE